MDREQEIQRIAYQLWEEEGRPIGRDFERWLRAEEIWGERRAQGRWETLRAELVKRKTANEPVRTLIRGLASWIDEVGNDYVVVRSERTGRPRRITKARIESSSDPTTRVIATLRQLGGYI